MSNSVPSTPHPHPTPRTTNDNPDAGHRIQQAITTALRQASHPPAYTTAHIDQATSIISTTTAALTEAHHAHHALFTRYRRLPLSLRTHDREPITASFRASERYGDTEGCGDFLALLSSMRRIRRALEAGRVREAYARACAIGIEAVRGRNEDLEGVVVRLERACAGLEEGGLLEDELDFLGG